MHGFETASVSSVPAFRIAHLVGLVRAEYQEMPGLCLTRAQMQRLWRLDPEACDTVVGALVKAGYLRLTNGGYMRG